MAAQQESNRYKWILPMFHNARTLVALIVFAFLSSNASALLADEAVADTAAVVSNQLTDAGAGLVSTIKSAIQGNQKSMQELMNNYLLPSAMALILLIVGYMVASFIGRIVGASVSKRVDKTLGRFAGKMVKNGIMIMVFLGGLGYFGVDVTSFAAIIAAVGFAVGMALQGTLGNFAAGIMLLVFRPFKVDDYISVNGVEGTVEEVDLFTTKLNTLDNRHLVVPNGKIFGETMENFTKNQYRRVDVNVGADYSADLERTRHTLQQAIAEISGSVASPAPQVYLCDLGDSSVNWQCRCWCDPADYWDVRERMTEEVKNALDAAAIGIPFPQLSVNVAGKFLSKRAA